jgi:hypothetical protein
MTPPVSPRRCLLVLACSVAALLPVTGRAQDLPFSNGLLYQLDASNPAGVVLNGTGVAAWNDLSGNGLNFVQASASKQPTLVANGLGGRNTIRFDGDLTGTVNGVGPNADELNLNTATNVRTFVAVNRLAGGNVSLAGIWGIENADTGVRRTNGTNTSWQTTANGNGNDFAFGGMTLVNNSTNPAVGEGVSHVLIAGSAANQTFGATSIGDYFGNGVNSPRTYKGDISEVLVFNRALTVPEANALTIHLAAKYQISLGGTIVNVGGTQAIGTEIYAGRTAQYVRIHTDGSGSGGDPGDANHNSFHMSEVEVFSGTSGPTTLNPSSNLGRQGSFATIIGTPGHGTDASVINGIADGGADTWTRNGLLADNLGPVEGLLTLGSDRLVNRVRVWNRGDGCCGERLANFSVTLEDASHNVLQTLSYAGAVPSGANYAEFDFADIDKNLTLQNNDLLAIEVSALGGTGDKLRLGADGLGVLSIASGVSLDISNLSGGSFAPGQSFDIMDFGSVSGTFANISLPGGAALWDTTQLYTTGVISVVPEPAAASLLLASALLGVRRRRAVR